MPTIPGAHRRFPPSLLRCELFSRRIRRRRPHAQVDERMRACAEDRNADSDYCSALVPSLQQELSDGEDEREGGDRPRARASVFRPRPAKDGGGSPVAYVGRLTSPKTAAADVYLTFRCEPVRLWVIYFIQHVAATAKSQPAHYGSPPGYRVREAAGAQV
jgi:hypothetical protein